jgi:hypothetical protein
MATVRALVTDAYMEIGVLGPGQSMNASLGALGLLRFQNQLDRWQAKRLMLAVLKRATFTLTSGTSSVTIGTGGSVTTTPVTTTAPMFLDGVFYVNPGSSPEQEVKIGQMDRDTYARLSIKQLASALPIQCFYQRSNTDALGTLFLWPQVTQNVTIVIYSPQGVGVPTSLDDTIIGPAGYASGFMLDLAFDLCAPTGTAMPAGLPDKRSEALKTMQAPNVMPAVLGVDPALTQISGAGYNILSDQIQTSR